MAQQPLVGQGFLIIEASRSHSDTPQSVGLLWTSDGLESETSTWQHKTFTTDRHLCPDRIGTSSSNKKLPQIHAFDRAPSVIVPSFNYLIISSDYLRCIFCNNEITPGDWWRYNSSFSLGFDLICKTAYSKSQGTMQAKIVNPFRVLMQTG